MTRGTIAHAVPVLCDEADLSNRNWLVNPFMFMIAVLVEAEPAPQGDPNDPSSTDAWKPVQGNNLLGQTVSSLHRLKDVNNAGMCGLGPRDFFDT